MNALYEGRAVIDDEGVNYWGAEIARNEVEVEISREVPLADFVRNRLAESVQVSRAQNALALELRSAMTGIHWAAVGGNLDSRREVLARVLARFDSGTTSRDITEARALLSSSS